LTRKETTAGLNNIVDDFKNKCPENAQNNVILIGNKCDHPDREVSAEEGKFLA
jgi:GTPase SAR1 family protein